LALFEQQTQERAFANRPSPVTKSFPVLPYETGQQSLKIEQSSQNWNSKSGVQHSQQYQTEGRYGSIASALVLDQPNFTPFPVIRNPPPNVPPTDEQKEATLEAAREAVLESNDPEIQLIWAQDALAYVEVAMQDEQRISTTQPPRARTPRIEHMLREDAMKVVDFLADQHHPKAEFLRGMWLEFGKFGRRIDKKEAFHCYARASEKGYARADYRLGMQFESSNEALKAIKYYQRGADAGDSASCYRLGMMTLLGQHGQIQDYERGLSLICTAAATADENAPQGAYVLGMLQARQLPQVSIPERFLPLDMAAARNNIGKAAYLGFAKAQVKMGSAYELCELGCDFNPALSLHYNVLAARQGEAEAEMSISKWFLCGHEGLFERNEEVAFTYAQRAAVSGLATAQFAMGYFYEVGIYVPVNFKEAKEWYSRAAASGNKDASNRIDSISRSKTLSRNDHESVTISKIRQQYGSHSRKASRLAPLPEIEQPSIDMPDPSKLTPNPRPSDYNRPQSTAPYPIDGGPPLPGLYGQSSTHALAEKPERPISAFGINPNLRSGSTTTTSGSTATTSGPRPAPYSRPGYPPQNRSYSNPSTNGPGYGRGNRPPANPVLSSGPVTVLQGRGQPRPGSASPYSNPQGGQTGPPPRPLKVDLGFSAPLDPFGADRKRQPGADEFPRKPQPPTPSTDAQPQRPYEKPLPSQPPQTGNDRNNQNRPPGNQRPLNSNIQAAKFAPSKASNLPAAKPSLTKPSKVSASTRPPTKSGPQTFQDMGIPQGKGEGDCVSISKCRHD
jgi:TPR repeat protein